VEDVDPAEEEEVSEVLVVEVEDSAVALVVDVVLVAVQVEEVSTAVVWVEPAVEDVVQVALADSTVVVLVESAALVA
jgi:hypothetical protein